MVVHDMTAPCEIDLSLMVPRIAQRYAALLLTMVSFPVQVYLQLVWANLLGQYARAHLLDSQPS
jgi:hypothetical protein